MEKLKKDTKQAYEKMTPTEVVVIEPPKGGNDSKLVKLLPKTVAPAPVNAKQQKAFHFLIAAASYNSVLEGKTESLDGICDLCERFYHGFDEDNIRMAANFLEGNGRFGVLWDDGFIAIGYGHLSGISHAQLSYYIVRPTLSGNKAITGRQILDKARTCYLEVKKY